jgi:hypothetical protein
MLQNLIIIGGTILVSSDLKLVFFFFFVLVPICYLINISILAYIYQV